MIAFHFPATAERGIGFGKPITEAIGRLEACAHELNVAAAKMPKGEDFGDRVTKAVQARVSSVMRPRGAVVANTAVAPKAEDDSFAERLKRACEERSGQKRHKEQAERERNRYPKQRKPCKGE